LPLRYPRPVALQEQILEALGRVIDPELRRPVTELDMVRGIDVGQDGAVVVTIALTVVGCPLRSSFEDQVQQHVAPLSGVTSVALRFDVMSPDERAALTVKLRGGTEVRGVQLPATTRVLAVASGKGGVGKSTVTVNLAAALASLGHEVGILDADIYGHSIPHMLGVRRKPVVVDKMIVPPVAHDLRLMSIGFFLDGNEPVMWRGPMLHRAFEQFLQDVHWGDLDVLVVDMPPGTGDVSISLGQLLPRAETVVVTTPQPLAQEVASRAATMAQKTGLRVAGVIENMTSDVFGTGGGARLATELGVPFLGHVPLDAALRESSDLGEPLVVSQPESETARALIEIARSLDEARTGGFTRTLPLVS
jgi:ATP-binding protein involved in chromosome partitioning